MCIEKMSIEDVGQALVNDGLLDKDYFDAICNAYEANVICLVLVGLDPFPTGSIGIPFCKTDWVDLQGGTGHIVFSSITGQAVLNQSTMNRNNPKDKAIELAKQGVIFLNSSYELLSSLDTNEDRERAKKQAFGFNKFIIASVYAKKIIFSGPLSFKYTNKYYKKQYPNFKSNLLNPLPYHPKARGSYRRSSAWTNYWPVGALKNSFNL